MLRITTEEDDKKITILLEGRVVGPWAVELNRTWSSTAPRVALRTVSIDLRNVTYTDSAGKQVLRDIFSQSGAELVTSTPWSQYLASEITAIPAGEKDQEASNALSK